MMSLAEVSATTGISLRTLRQWCATGRIYCEKDGAGWLVRERDLTMVAELAPSLAGDGPEPVALIVPVEEPLKLDLAAEVARRLGLAPTTVAMSSLVIDGQEYAVAVWKDTDGAGGLAEVHELATELGGSLLDGTTAHIDALRPLRPTAETQEDGAPEPRQ
jgi:hypothetical protein